MKQYLDLIRTVLDQGEWQDNRTGIRTISIPGASMRFDLREGFPAVTTKKLAFKSAIGELIAFLRATRNAAGFRALGCKAWDANANENAQWLANPYRAGADDLGPVYGVQWRQWPGYKVIDQFSPAQIEDAIKRGYEPVTRFEKDGRTWLLLYKAIDQLQQCLETIVANPSDRRILFHGWNPAVLEEVALPACHLLYQFLPRNLSRDISLCLYIRSNDLGLGAPWNIAEAAALLHLVSRLTGYEPRWLTVFIGDAHIYENHLPMLEEQLKREPYPLPRLALSSRIPDFRVTKTLDVSWLEKVEPADFVLEGYQHHEALTAPMAV
jgi:thymidylate synthase